MAIYQSEAQLEAQLISKLQTIGYKYVNIKSYENLVKHFRDVLNEFNKKELTKIYLEFFSYLTKNLNY